MMNYERAIVLSVMHALEVTAEVDLRYAIRVLQTWTNVVEAELRKRKGKGASDSGRKREGDE